MTCLGAFDVSAAMRALVLLALSCCHFHLFGEIWICLVFVSFVIPSLTVLHVVCGAFLGSLFGFVSYHFVMFLHSSTDHGLSKAFAQVCPGLGSCPSDLAQVSGFLHFPTTRICTVTAARNCVFVCCLLRGCMRLFCSFVAT